MITVSNRFKKAMRDSHQAVMFAEVIREDQDPVRLSVLGGEVTLTQSDNVNHSAQLEVIDSDGLFTFNDMQQLLSPFTSRIRICRGVQYSDGTQEVPGLCVVYPTSMKESEKDGAVTFDITAYDAAVKCQGSMTRPLSLPSGMNVNDAAIKLLTRVFPSMRFELEHTDWTTPAQIIREDSNPWDEAAQLLAMSGMRLYVDREGICRSTSTVRLPSVDIAWEFIEGENAEFWDPTSSFDVDQFPNVVVVVGTHSAHPEVRAEAADMDPKSPTYRYGNYGEQVKTVRSTHVADIVQAQQAATGILTRLLSPSDETTFSFVPNPILDPADTVVVQRERMGMHRRKLLLDTIKIPLTAGEEATATARRSVAVSDDELVLEVL
jgi:hypothetical protein